MERKSIGLLSLMGIVLLCLVFFAGCTGIHSTAPSPTAPPAAQSTTGIHAGTTIPALGSDNVKDVVDANNRFAFDLYSQLAKDPEYEGGNLFFSPFSISSAVAIAYEGARNTTADEIRSAFHFPEDMTTIRKGYAGIISKITNRNAAYTLRTANALWAEKTYPFLPGYIDTASRYYAANTTNLDFIKSSEDSRKTINRWVEEKTENKIRDLLPAGSIHPLTRLVITDAVYFNGTWVRQFDPDRTQEADFTVAPGKTVRVSMMEKTDEKSVYAYAETGEIQLLRMPYQQGNGTRLSMLVLLPKSDDLAAAEAVLDPQNLSGLDNLSAYRQVMVYIPKFTLETRYSLPPVLAALGMRTAFSGDADFSGMDGTTWLYIEEIVHKAYVDVNEEGTEAAGATAIAVSGKGLSVPEEPVPVFRADHPFLFIISDDKTGTILFVGRVTNPAG